MKPSPSILIAVALFAFIANNATPKVNTESAPMCARFTAAWHALRLPVAHLRFAGAALVFELGSRSAGPGTAPAAQPVTLRLTVSRSGKAAISLRAHNLRFVFPCRGA
jgi:hypothetical protein